MIPDIYIAAIVASGLSILMIGGLLFLRAAREDRPFLGLLVLLMLPMNVVALHFIVARRRIGTGIMIAMALHFAGNFPIFLARKNMLGLGTGAWTVILQIWVLFYFLAMGGLLAYMVYGKGWARKLLRGTVKCPVCGKVYEHPMFGLNLLHKRYERCPHCRGWHLVSAFNEEETPANNQGEHPR